MILGRYEVVTEIGRGGMGRVLAARDPALGRDVAIKVVTEAGTDAALIASLWEEARITSRLQHPNIIPIYDVGNLPGGELFFVMKRVEGTSLRQSPPLPMARRLAIFAAVCAGMAYAHQQGVVHGDLKPDNVLISADGEILIVDWGMAQRVGAPTALGGTPGYMSPEQANGAPVDPRMDVWSLGALLYELLTDQPAWPGSTPYSLVLVPMQAPPPDPRVIAPNVPEALAMICAKALENLPDARYANAGDLGEALARFQDNAARRAQADGWVAQAHAAQRAVEQLQLEASRLALQEQQLIKQIPAWAPLEEKAPLLDVRAHLRDLHAEQAVTAASVVSHAERALSQDPTHPGARALMAEVWWGRFLQAEQADDPTAMALYADLLRAYDDGTRAQQLDAGGRLTLRSIPSGAEVTLAPYQTNALVWTTGPATLIGTTPLGPISIPRGAWCLTLTVPGRPPVCCPLWIGRATERTLHIQVPPARDASWVYVPAGPCQIGGDPLLGGQLPKSEVNVAPFWIQRFPITMGAWRDYLNAIDRAEALQRMPRREPSADGVAAPYWPAPATNAPFVIPAQDAEGDVWSEDFPVFGISWFDACAYAAWRSAQEGRRLRLPLEIEWEKAARGADGRFFPWGNQFDPVLCKMSESRAGTPKPEPVGNFPTDCSPYGVRDMAGNIREWCGDLTFDNDPKRRVVRGGAWLGSARLCRAANRFGFTPVSNVPYIGFRLAENIE